MRIVTRITAAALVVCTIGAPLPGFAAQDCRSICRNLPPRSAIDSNGSESCRDYIDNSGSQCTWTTSPKQNRYRATRARR